MIVDSHCHAGKGDRLTAPWNTDAPIGGYLKRANAAGIQKTVVFAPFHSDYRVANAQVGRIVNRYPERLIGFAFVHAERDAGRIQPMVEEAIVRWGFRGIKVHGRDAMPTREVCETAKRLGLPVLVDVIGKAWVVDMFAGQFPEVDFIVAHIGSFTGDWRAHQLVIDQMTRYPNVYADTAGVHRFDYLVEAVRRAGAHKLLFGSDGPWLHPALELMKIRLLHLKQAEEKLVLGGNILHLMNRRKSSAILGRSTLAVPQRQEKASLIRQGTQNNAEGLAEGGDEWSGEW